MSAGHRLDDYRDKRDFRRTAEPRGDASQAEGRRFAIQHHASSTDHYDLRLEHDGALLSWAVPKGPSTDPSEKRYATRTEDHPVDYLDFEGTIPADEYGGGAVIVWDMGEWEHTTTDDDGSPVSVETALENGHLTFAVDGHKLSGGYVLQRFRPDEDGWLLIKMDDDGADARRRPTSTEPRSVLSGRTVGETAG